MHTRSGRHRRWPLLVVAFALLATSCRRVPTALFSESDPTPLTTYYVTQDPGDTYETDGDDGTVRISAPESNTAANTRVIVWPTDTDPAENMQSCAEWTDATGIPVQQGIALRVRQDGDRFRAITVTKNVLFGSFWKFNVNTWDTDRTPLMRVHGQVAIVPLDEGLAGAPLPWRICARVVGDEIAIKGWRSGEPVPTWSDADHTGTVQLPEGWTYPGQAGWYAGHVPAGGTVGMSHLRTTTWSIPSERPRRSEEVSTNR